MGCLGVYLGVIRGRSSQGHRQCHHLIEHADTTSVYSASIETMCCLSFYRLLFVESRRRRTFSTTAPRLLSRWSMTICWWRLTVVLCICSTYQQPLTQSTTTCYSADACGDSNVSTVWEVPSSSGSVYTSLVELSKSSMETVRHQPSTSHVPYHKAQCSVRV